MKRLMAGLSIGACLVTGCSSQTAVPSNNAASRANNTPKPQNSIAHGIETSPNSWSAGVVMYPQEVDNQSFQVQKIVTLSSAQRFSIVGKMRTFEAVGATRLLVNGNPVVPSSGTHDGVNIIHASAGAPAWGDFKTQYEYPTSLRGHRAVIEFYFNSPKDGSKQDLLQLHVLLP